MTEDNAILGLGNDIIEIDRLRSGYQAHKQRFWDRLFTKKEQEYCQKHKDPLPHFAGRFSAKESIVKALGCGFGEQVVWQDIEILPDGKGRPLVHLSEGLNKRFNNPKILVAISHCKLYATATAIWLR